MNFAKKNVETKKNQVKLSKLATSMAMKMKITVISVRHYPVASTFLGIQLLLDNLFQLNFLLD